MNKFFITDKCVHCGACKSDCPVQAIEMTRGSKEKIIPAPSFSINQNKCIRCGDCYEICPVGAVEKIEL